MLIKCLNTVLYRVFQGWLDNKLIPTKLSKIQQDFYDALNS